VASVTVFVDDAVRGNLPPVCVVTGEPADAPVNASVPIGGLGLLWLLVLAGPIGWVVLLVLAASGFGRETLIVKLPYSHDAFVRERTLRTVRDLALLATFIFVIGWVVQFLGVAGVWAVLAGVCLGTSLVSHVRLDWRGAQVSLDGSRRWVHLAHVHPAFVEAVQLALPAEHRLPS
jgi:hypothetical protein